MQRVLLPINLEIWRAFKRAGMVIPYPQRDRHIRTGLDASKPQEPNTRENDYDQKS